MKSWQAVLITAILCPAVLLTGCAGQSASPAAADVQSTVSTPAAATSLTVACISGVFNPYINNTTLTLQNAGLLFEPFVCITPDMELEYRLAQNVESSGTTVTIQLRSGCCFADGSPITAQDAAASLNAARSSSTYSARFAHVISVAVQGNTIVLTLDRPDSLFAYLLDIPLLREGEAGQPQPTPTGRYTYGADGLTLVKNPFTRFASDGPDEIQLFPVSNYDEMVSALSIGEIDLYLSPGGTSTSGGITTTETYYKTNNLLFLGINAYSSNPLCNTSAGRVLLSSLLNRRDIAAKCYYSRAYAATGILNSFYPCVRGLQTIQAESDKTALEATMSQLGYQRDESTGLYTDAAGRPAAVRLLVYTGNTYKRYTASLLLQQWAECGISVTLEEADAFEDYLAAVHRGEFELYIGEMKLYNNMELDPFWSGSASAGLAPSAELLAAYDAFRTDASQAELLESLFAAEMPCIPLLWQNGSVVFGRRTSGLVPSLSDPFYSMEGLVQTN